MAFGRIRLDADGFTANTEEGLSEIFSARRLYELFLRDPNDPTNNLRPASFGFWNPGSLNKRDFLLPIPRQFNPRWFSDARQQHHTLKRAQWTFAAGTRVLTFQPSDKLFTGATAHNEWLSIYAPSSVVSLDNVDYTNLFAAAGVPAPTGMKTVAKCGTCPPTVGTPLGSTGYENYTPFLQFVNYPPPDNALVFGWSNFAVVIFGNGGYLLQNLSGDRRHWKRLIWWSLQTRDITISSDYVADNFGEGLSAVKAAVDGFLVAQLGMEDLFLDFLHGGGYRVKWRDSGFPPVAASFATGPWWVGCAEKQKIAFHAEIVGYENASTIPADPTAPAARPILFDFGGPDFAPSVEPTFLPVTTMHLQPGESTDITTGFAGNVYTDNVGEFIIFALEDFDAAPGTLWTSGSGAYRGTMHLSLLPGNLGSVNAGYLAPNIVLIELDFDQVKNDRQNNELILYDHLHYDGWTIESGMYDAPHGAFRISCLESLSEEIENAGFHERSGYPIVYEESLDGETWFPRWKAWAEEPELHEETVEGTSGVPGFRRYVLKARPMIARADQKWSAIPRIIDPNGNGFIEQVYAVSKVMSSASINVENSDEWYIYPDPDAGTPRSQLPGTWGHHTGKGAEGDQDIWGPTWNETKLKYCQRIAKRWATWVLYCQLNGRVLYHPGLLEHPDEYTFFDAFPLFQTSQEAAAAGFRPDQIWTEVVDQEVIQPKYNILSIYGSDDNENTVRAVIRDDASINGTLAFAGGTYTPDNFLGEKKPESFVTRLAVGKQSLINLAMAAFRRGTRKRVLRRFSIDLAPWQIEGSSDEPFDVGAGFFASGRGRFVCIHLSCQLKHRDTYRTIATGERIPPSMLLGTFPGFFPGEGLL